MVNEPTPLEKFTVTIKSIAIAHPPHLCGDKAKVCMSTLNIYLGIFFFNFFNCNINIYYFFKFNVIIKI